MRPTPPEPGVLELPSYPLLSKADTVGGPELFILPHRKFPHVTLAAGFPLGRVHEPPHPRGFVDLAIELLKEGTHRRSGREIAETLDRYAVQYDQEVQPEYSLLSAACLPVHLETALALLAEMIQTPAFPESEFDILRNRWLSLLYAQRSDPSFLAAERIHAAYFGEHPYSRITIPPEDLQQLTAQDVRSFYATHFPSHGSFLLVAGDFDEDAVQTSVGRLFTDWNTRRGAEIDPPPPPPDKTVIHLVHRPGSVQAHLSLALPGLPVLDARRDALRLAVQGWGGGGSARLFLKLREERGLTYGVYSSQAAFSRAGYVEVTTDVHQEAAAEAVDLILSEAERLVSQPPQGEELERCRSELAGAYLRRLESVSNLGLLEAERILQRLPEDYFATYLERLRTTGPDDVASVLRELWTPLIPTIAVVGDRVVLEPQLQEMGPIVVYDTSGRRLA